MTEPMMATRRTEGGRAVGLDDGLTLANLPEASPGLPPLVSTVDHFRVVDRGERGASTMVLYRAGVHIPREHGDLEIVPAVFDEDDGAWVPDDDDDATPAERAASTVDAAPKRGGRR